MYYFSTNRFRCLFFRLNDFDVFFFDILKSTKTQSIILLFDQNFFDHLHFDVLAIDVFIFDIFHFDFCLSIINFRSIDFDLYFSMYFFSMFQGALCFGRDMVCILFKPLPLRVVYHQSFVLVFCRWWIS